MEPADWPDPDPDHALTWRQQEILQAITDLAQRRRYSPTLRQIGAAAGLASTSSVSDPLSILQRKGYLRRDAGRPRTVELRVPGQPTPAWRSRTWRTQPTSRPKTPPAFLSPSTARSPQGLKPGRADPRGHLGAAQGTRWRRDTVPPPVHGDSMINAAITDGDVSWCANSPRPRTAKSWRP